ncbi:Tab2/Atab2 family RNA-binding protein [Gloeobacter kilaueensis]|uniref:DUF1092 family protein n=1 Tax=Gloeobacter kilaueensis (strain ATCC BAA-2537 / CCAP 1431/1 / ULC 316 / JS1) TaxID=1183438 RepID=U5QEP2_GLOK1|nr:Tab2/Atab2 family RNA-binding protein [Gloeobacter kilaueensis]AGY57422.1 hypothetical protein GKIL_1176 [Gloeobacter kilaueensis JS1]
MEPWELDFYRCPLVGAAGQRLWELLVCTASGRMLLSRFCEAKEATTDWLTAQLAALVTREGGPPLEIGSFRTATYNLALPACRELGIPLRHSRRTIAVLRQRAERERNIYPQRPDYRPLPAAVALQKAVPEPFPDELLADSWGFSALPGSEIAQLHQLPISYLEAPLIAIDAPVPGVFLFSATRARAIAGWLSVHEPVSLQYTRSQIDGIVLETGLDERWILATFNDPEMRRRGEQFQERLQQSTGLHFLAVRPEQSGHEITGFWLLQTPL